MKKNININMFGVIYAIDEDAYDLLKKYLENMRSYYSRRSGGEEIANDVESRVAELFADLKAQGVEAITIEHVEDIIKRIGDPQQMDEEADVKSERVMDGGYAEAVDDKSVRKLYRDPDDKILGGVISGLCHYLGIEDPVIARLIFLLLVFFSHAILVVVYAVCWALIPEAKTAEERLQMKGKRVTPNAINEELMQGVDRAKKFVNDPENQRKASGCLATFVKVCFFSFLGFLTLICGSILLCVLVALFVSLGATMFGIGGTMIGLGIDPDFVNMLNTVPTWVQWTFAGATILVLAIPLFMLLHKLLSKPEKSMSTGAVVTMIIVWILALGVAISTLVPIAASFAEKEYNFHKHYRAEVVVEQPATAEAEAVFVS
ncbi:MAG: PspC domain-containing protein [Bacteroidaceae bacterium]|nr:PspC domain-containing protein [Bacteroidaceae bacterium]